MQLVREFYWCDEESFWIMKVPYRDAKDFALTPIRPEDALLDVFNFFERVSKAQQAARNYCARLAVLRPELSNPWMDCGVARFKGNLIPENAKPK